MSLVLLEKEDRGFLSSLAAIPSTFKGTRPRKISAADWHRTENQGPMGSCRGNSGTSVLEKLAFVRNKSRVQLSRIFFYLATQKIDGLLGGDRGCTISNGFKLMLETGCPLEESTGYPGSYPGSTERQQVLASENYAAGAPFKALSVRQAPTEYDDVCDVVAGGGAIDFGIMWSGIPSDRVIRNWRPGNGGHANWIAGYDDDRRMYEAWNSHGDGLYWITPEAWKQMMAHRWTAAGAVFGQTEPEFVNWTEGYL